VADGFDWHSLLEQGLPVVAGLLGNQPAQSGFQSGFMRGQELAKQERERKTITNQRSNAAGADYLLKIGEHAQQFEDPVALDQFLTLAEDAGTKAGYIQPGELKGRFTVPASKLAAARLKSASPTLNSPLERSRSRSVSATCLAIG